MVFEKGEVGDGGGAMWHSRGPSAWQVLMLKIDVTMVVEFIISIWTLKPNCVEPRTKESLLSGVSSDNAYTPAEDGVCLEQVQG